MFADGGIRLGVALAFAVIPALLVLRGWRAKPTSGKLANLGLAAGLMLLLTVHFAGTARRADATPWLTVVSVAGMSLGAAAIGLAIVALRKRRTDDGCSVWLAAGAGLSGVAHLLLAAGFVLIPFAATLPSRGTAWTYRNAEWGFQLQVPSEQWHELADPSCIVRLVYGPHHISMAVKGQTGHADQFDKWVRLLDRDFSEGPSLSNRTRSDESLGDEIPCTIWTGEETTAAGDSLVLVMATAAVGERIITLQYEAAITNRSKMGQESQKEEFIKVGLDMARSLRSYDAPDA